MIAPTAGVKAVMNSTCRSPTSPAVSQGFWFFFFIARPLSAAPAVAKATASRGCAGLAAAPSVNADLYVKADGTAALARASWLSVCVRACAYVRLKVSGDVQSGRHPFCLDILLILTAHIPRL